MIFYNHIPGLWDLDIGSVALGCKSKSITSYYSTCENIYMLTELTFGIKFYSRIENAMITDFNIVTDMAARTDISMVANSYIFTDVTKSTNKYLVPIFCRCINTNRLLNTRYPLFF